MDLQREIQFASSFRQGEREDGTDPERFGITAYELQHDLRPDSTWAELTLSGLTVALSQEDQVCLRTALIAHAGQVLAWLKDIDQRTEEAA